MLGQSLCKKSEVANHYLRLKGCIDNLNINKRVNYNENVIFRRRFTLKTYSS
jgi:hypothetical protein